MTETIRAIIQELNGLAQQIYVLATGLKNAAPQGVPGQSVQYLLETTAQITQMSTEIEKLLQTSQQQIELQSQLIAWVRAIVNSDEALREKYEIENKFRFVRDRLRIILENLEEKESQLALKLKKDETDTELRDDEIVVYVYLYNANGIALSSWYNMLTPKVFLEYSVNRPIYTDRSQIDNLLKLKNNKAQHAYLMVAVKAVDILRAEAPVKIKPSASMVVP